MNIVLSIVQGFLLIILAPLLAGFIKKVKARLQNRRGPGLLQVYFDLGKLLAKDSVISPTASWVFRAAPYIFFGATAAAAALVPFLPHAMAGLSDMFILLYLFALGRFFMVLASLDAGSAFGGMGGSREMFVSALAEPALLLSLLTIALRGNSTTLDTLANAAAQVPFTAPYILSAVAFLIVVVAETGRIPVDNPDTHLELTMIHEGMVLEYSGRYLALITWAAALKQLIVILLFVSWFLPWDFGLGASPAGYVLWLVKAAAAAALIAAIETSTNKMRLFRVPGFLGVSCILSVLALVAQ